MLAGSLQCYFVRGIDIQTNEDQRVVAANLVTESILLPSDYFDFVTAFDFLEHVPRQLFLRDRLAYLFIDLLIEIHCVLKPKGIFLSLTPCYPF